MIVEILIAWAFALIMAILTMGICYWWIRDETRYYELIRGVENDLDLTP